MDQQQDITDFQSLFNGPFPFTSDGVVVGTPSASFEEEMQTMITFAGGQIDLDTFYHENMHQWWGDNVSEANYNLTFFKEGMATLGEYLFAARNARAAAGGPDTPAGRRRVRGQPGQPVQHQLRQTAAASGPAPRRPDAVEPVLRHAPPTRARARRTSRCARSSARPTSTRRCSRSSATTAAAASPRRSSRRRSAQWLPNQSAACQARLEPVLHASGSTPPTRARRRRQPAADHRPRAWPAPASTTPRRLHYGA